MEGVAIVFSEEHIARQHAVTGGYTGCVALVGWYVYSYSFVVWFYLNFRRAIFVLIYVSTYSFAVYVLWLLCLHTKHMSVRSRAIIDAMTHGPTFEGCWPEVRFVQRHTMTPRDLLISLLFMFALA